MKIRKELKEAFKVGGSKKLPSIKFIYCNKNLFNRLDLRCEEGYILGWHKYMSGKNCKGVIIDLRYSGLDNQPGILKFEPRFSIKSKNSSSKEKVWDDGSGLGTRFYQSTKGLKTVKEIRKLGLGGYKYLWVI